MKKVLILISLIIFLACDNSSLKTKKESEKESEKEISDVESNEWYINEILESDAEKIGLISIIKDVPKEQTNLILRDYLSKTDRGISDYFDLMDKNPDYISKLVDSIAQKYNYSRKLTASIIFSYQYEVITEDEIIQKYLEEKEND